MSQRIAKVSLLAFSLAILPPFLRADDPTPQSLIDRTLTSGDGAEKIKQFKAISFETDFNDYREFDGVRHCTKLQLGVTEGSMVDFAVREVKLHRSYDVGAFKMPC